MEAAQQWQKSYADSKRRAVQFAVGQEVLLSTTNNKSKFKGSAKLLPKWIGPFKVTEEINPVAFRLKLPETLKLHDVFHASCNEHQVMMQAANLLQSPTSKS
jgi:hypothetical protein